ncbi:hypothetical protein [Yersinia enterocolitica]|uniref:hypothetical protein n=1 Tax=Yersinia enterocolitica TaxID=630 RepID=UPI0005DE1D85|nr:hypothetical protein [Yersinia enterocolitica]CQH41998.1 phage-like protein [Yersinia enterocolitica]
MSNFVKIKKDDKYFILNTESVESVFPDAPGSIIKLLNGDSIRTFAEIDVIAAALVPSKEAGHTAEEYSECETINPASLGEEITIHRRRYFNHGEVAGYLFFGVTGCATKEVVAAVFEKLPR